MTQKKKSSELRKQDMEGSEVQGDWTTAHRDENIIDELKVLSKDAGECVESTIRQSVVVRMEVVSVRI